MSGLDYSLDDIGVQSAASKINEVAKQVEKAQKVEEIFNTIGDSVSQVIPVVPPKQLATAAGSSCIMCKIGKMDKALVNGFVVCSSCGLYTSESTTLLQAPEPELVDKKKADKFFIDTAQLDECIAQAEHLQDVIHSDSMALKVVGILSFGLRKSGELLAIAIYDHKMAKADLKRAQAIAALEEFHAYSRDQKEAGVDVKSTDTTRGHYININEGVSRATEKEAFCEAVVSQLDSYKTQFTMVLSAVKAMISKQRGDALISSVATPTASPTKDEYPF